MEWRHKTDINWMMARAWFLNFSDVKKLLPYTNTGRKRTVTEQDYWGILGEKLKYIDELDCISTGAAARGHILEPYAVKDFNEFDKSTSFIMHHWDDIVVGGKEFGSLGFSPDALSFHPAEYLPSSSMFPMYTLDASIIDNAISSIEGLEIKSYGAGKIYQMCHEDKMKLEERWQIATAMAVLKHLDTMYLTLYNPSLQGTIWTIPYTRYDLADEIDAVIITEETWQEFLTKNNDSKCSFASMVNYSWQHHQENKELKIWEEYMSERNLSARLDPI